MGRHFEELDWQSTDMGEISLRRRLDRTVQLDVYEVKLGDEFLMSSLFPVAEIELAGLGLGYTAVTALEEPRVRSLVVVEALAPVIGWHEKQLLPDAASLTTDPRTRIVQGDFFALAGATDGFGPEEPRLVHAVLLDIDHSPQHVLHPSHAAFYTPDGLVALRTHLHPGGVFALWSDDPPDDDFLAVAGEVFASVEAQVVTFANPLTRGTSSNTVYVA